MTNDAPVPTRREFHRALLAVAPLAAGQQAVAQEPKEARNGVADSLAALAKAKYGKLLTAEQLELVKQALQRDLMSAEFLKQMPLKNSDEPSFVFRADLP